MSSPRSLALLALATGLATLSTATAAVSGSGSTTRYWDCCKGSCSWDGKASVSAPVTTCDASDNALTDYSAASGCDGGTAYMCSDQSPWAVNSTFAYGFAAVSIPDESESDWCCACYELTFTSGSVEGKKMVVQATNTGADLAEGQFDLAIPGGGVGIYNGCTDEWGAPSEGWGAQYGGISSNTCSSFPSALQPGCNFRFGDFFEGADNPTVDYVQVTCPKALTDKTGCIRSGETPTDGDDSSSSSAAASSTTAATSSTASPSTVATSISSYSSAAAVSATQASSSESAFVSSVVASSSAIYSSEPSSSVVAPVGTAPVGSAPVGTVPMGTAPLGTAPPYPSAGGPPPGGEACEVQYVYADE